MGRNRGLVVLRHAGFRRLVIGQLASNVGDAFYAVALPWYVLATHGGALLLAVVLVAYGVPRTVVLAVGGYASDRWRPWTVMVVADTVRVIAVAALAAAAAVGPAKATWLVPVAIVLGAAEGLFLPGSFSIIPSLLPGEQLQTGNALSSSGTQLALLIGPALGGGVVAAAGPVPALAVDAATFAISAVSLLAVRRTQAGVGGSTDMTGWSPSRADNPAGHAAAGDGARGVAAMSMWRLLRTERILLIVLTFGAAANLGMGGLGEVAIPVLAHGPFQAGAAGYGALLAAFGAGALFGTLLASQTLSFRRPFSAASYGLAAQSGLITVTPYLGGIVGAACWLALLGAFNGSTNVVLLTALQRWAPPALLGRVMGALLLCAFGVVPLSALIAGVVIRHLGVAAFFPIAGGLMALAVLAAVSQKEWRRFTPPGGDRSSAASATLPGSPAAAAKP